MNYGAIKEFSIENGPGVRVSLFVSGCRNHCRDCFSSQTWDFNYGLPFDEKAEEAIANALKPDYIEGLTLLGGEPLEPENQKELLPFLQRISEKFPDKTIWIYSGFTFENIRGSRADTEYLMPLLALCDVMVDGPFVPELRNLSLAFRGSSNQRILDLKKSLEAGAAIAAEL